MSERDPAVYSNVSRLRYDAVDCESWTHHLTWKELAEEREQEIAKLSKWAAICADLDRCEHGRHEGDVCDGCKGPSHGNLLAGHAPIGHGISAEHIHVPQRDRKHDPDEWRSRGPCRDPEQVGTPCPINPIQAGRDLSRDPRSGYYGKPEALAEARAELDGE